MRSSEYSPILIIGVNSFPAYGQAASNVKLETEHHDPGSITEKPCPFSARLLVRRYRSGFGRKLTRKLRPSSGNVYPTAINPVRESLWTPFVSL